MTMTPQIRAIAVLSLVSSLVPYTVIAQGNSSSILSNVAAVGNSSSVLSTGVAVGNYSDDVISVDTAWANYFPPYEGTSDPVLNDYYDNSTIGLDLTNETAFWSQPEMSLMAAKDFYLRIMPLGASITEGVRSSDGNGYRKYLRDQLRWKGWRVNMVGSKQNGNMADKDNEGMTDYQIIIRT
ncbi:hypothetical protein SLS60_010035 [Paraconiothyrium brasiliense]|uniref:Uncharacterized protein n=1 Tax=Paraconiothyrium brasiliense TaxID=300254 RepID=A0ABR3QT66_9PLEO